MPRIPITISLQSKISKDFERNDSLWVHQQSQESRKQLTKKNQFSIFRRHLENSQSSIILPRSNQPPLKLRLKNEKGLATAFMLTALPFLLSGLFFFGFSGFLVKNWMQSLHICRTNLIQTQKDVSGDLDKLMKMNPLAKSLRLALTVAKIRLAAALASYNYPLAAETTREIYQIINQQRNLDKAQKLLIQMANLKMQRGAYKAYIKLRSQSMALQAQLPNYLKYKIKPNLPVPVLLAVKPDLPGPAPVYVHKPSFSESQALSVNWISSFTSGNKEKMLWLKSTHSKRDSCRISLEQKNQSYVVKMLADKFSQRLSF